MAKTITQLPDATSVADGDELIVQQSGVTKRATKLEVIAGIKNASIASDAAIAFSKLAALDSANILVGSASNVATKVSVTGDVTISNTGEVTIANGAVTSAKLASGAGEALVPAGAVMAFAMNSAPSGWLAADGTAVSRSTYAALFSAIGTTHGVGDGSTTFNVPDLRGIFVRGSGSQAIGGITYNKTFAAKEGDAFQGHYHSVSHNAATPNGANGAGSTPLLCGPATISVLGPTSDGTNGTPRTASETRPANLALLYCVKF